MGKGTIYRLEEMDLWQWALKNNDFKTGEEESEGSQEENDKDKEDENQEQEMSQKAKW